MLFNKHLSFLYMNVSTNEKRIMSFRKIPNTATSITIVIGARMRMLSVILKLCNNDELLE